ncbi:alpha/beta hydrolase [Acinetobacter larvae]|uniref:alpha/beta hydrolase n=1 Tax=Acinetobacter larvae TaxID=1789224 RepID=UPI000A575944|nr:alpha/beta hydrolase-fold protein [Acinetobacter larvae]
MIARLVLCSVLLSAFTTAISHAQTTSSPAKPMHSGPQIPQQLPSTSQFQLHSQYTQQDYLIQVAQPSTPAPAQGYAVLYVLDGNATFDAARAMGASFAQGSARMGLVPTVIVSIGYPNTALFNVAARAKDYTPQPKHPIERNPEREYGGAQQFAQFIEQELKPKIQSDFHINPQQQSLYGHSFGGLFVLEQFFQEQQHFQRYIAASPSLWFDQYALTYSQQQWLQKSTKAHQTPAMLMITYGSSELRTDQDLAQKQQNEKQFIETFQQLPTQGLQFWSFVHPQEQHVSNLYASLPKALYLAACQDVNSCQNILGKPHAVATPTLSTGQ